MHLQFKEGKRDRRREGKKKRLDIIYSGTSRATFNGKKIRNRDAVAGCNERSPRVLGMSSSHTWNVLRTLGAPWVRPLCASWSKSWPKRCYTKQNLPFSDISNHIYIYIYTHAMLFTSSINFKLIPRYRSKFNFQLTSKPSRYYSPIISKFKSNKLYLFPQ